MSNSAVMTADSTHQIRQRSVLVLAPSSKSYSFPAWRLNEGEHLIGSSVECDYSLPIKGISAQHCAISIHNGQATVTSIDARTWLNDFPFRKSRLTAGDQLTLGPLTLVVGQETHNEPLPKSITQPAEPEISAGHTLAKPKSSRSAQSQSAGFAEQELLHLREQLTDLSSQITSLRKSPEPSQSVEEKQRDSHGAAPQGDHQQPLSTERADEQLHRQQEELEEQRAILARERQALQQAKQELHADRSSFDAAMKSLSAKDEQLVQRLGELDRRTEELSRLVNESQQRERQFEAEYEQKQAEWRRQDAKYAEMLAEVESKQRKADAAVNQFTAREQELQAREANLKSLRRELEEQQKQYEQQRTQLLAERTEHEELKQKIETERESLIARREELELKLKEFSVTRQTHLEQVAAQEQKFSVAQEDLDHRERYLEQRLAAADERGEQLQQQEERIAEQRAAAHRQLGLLREQLETERLHLAVLQQEQQAGIERLLNRERVHQQHRAALEREKRELPQRTEERTQEATSETSAIKTQLHDLRRREEELNRRGTELDTQAEQITRQKQALDQLQSDLDARQAELQTREEELSQKEEAFEQNRKELEEQLEALDQQRSELEQLEAELTSPQSSALQEQQEQSVELQLDQQQRELERLLDELEVERERTANTKAEFEQFQLISQQNKQAFETTTSRLEQAERELLDRECRLDELSRELEAAHDDVEHLEQQLDTLEQATVPEPEAHEPQHTEEEFNALANQLDEAKEILADRTRRMEELSHQLEVAQSEIESLKNAAATESDHEMISASDGIEEPIEQSEAAPTDTEEAPHRLVDTLFSNPERSEQAEPTSEQPDAPEAEAHENLEPSEEDEPSDDDTMTDLRSKLFEMFDLHPTRAVATHEPGEEPSAVETEDVITRIAEDDFADEGLSPQNRSRANDPETIDESAIVAQSKSDNTLQQPVAQQPDAATAQREEDEEEEISVASYMEKLLARSRRGAEPEAVAPEPRRPSHLQVTTNPEPSSAALETQLPEVPREDLLTEPPTPITTVDKDDVRRKMNSFREIANFSARSAVAKHSMKRLRTKIMINTLLTVVSFTVFVVLGTASLWTNTTYYAYAIFAGVTACVTGYELHKTTLMMHGMRVKSEPADAQDQQGSEAEA